MQNSQNKSPEPNLAVRWAREAKAYILERVAPISMLWLAVAIGAGLLPAIFTRLGKNPASYGEISLEDFVDQRLLWLFGMGFAVLTVLFQVTRRLVTYGSKEQENEATFFERVWDEISGACTHLACGLAVLWFLGPQKAVFPGVIWAYLLLGLFAFRMPKAGTDVEDASHRSDTP